MKTFRLIGAGIIAILLSFTFTACDKDNEDESDYTTIVGEWQDGSTTLILGSDGSYTSINKSIPSHTQYRRGTYSYNSKQGLLIINVKASNENGAYQQTLVVQTLTKSTLVLLYTDGDVEGYYERIK